MDFEKIDIQTLLPQKPPFVFVDRLLLFDDTQTVTAFEIRPDNILLENPRFSAAGMVENIAQTCATRIGYINTYIYKKKMLLGFIGAIRNLQVFKLPKIGDTLITTITVMEDIFGVTLVHATVKVGEEIFAEGDMKIAISDKEAYVHEE